MLRTYFASPILLLTISAALSCQKPREPDTNFDSLNDLVAGITKADRVVLLEGLPHHFLEHTPWEKELQSKKTVKHRDYPFYEEALQWKGEDAKEIAKLLTTPNSFVEFTGEKKCDGFHPDYCVEWQIGKDVYRSLICFGCDEVILTGPKTELRCDIKKEAYGKLKELLTPYVKNRPKREEP